jgi:hypothetical protein
MNNSQFLLLKVFNINISTSVISKYFGLNCRYLWIEFAEPLGCLAANDPTLFAPTYMGLHLWIEFAGPLGCLAANNPTLFAPLYMGLYRLLLVRLTVSFVGPATDVTH